MEHDNAIWKDFCPDCKGFGHPAGCKCSNEVDFICGCCKTCGGEGFVTVKPPPRKVIYGPYGTVVALLDNLKPQPLKIVEA